MNKPPSNETNGPQEPGDNYVQSFARGLEVIRSFSAAAPRQTLTEVAERTGLTRAGARRILLTLQTLGYVSHDGRLFQLSLDPRSGVCLSFFAALLEPGRTRHGETGRRCERVLLGRGS